MNCLDCHKPLHPSDENEDARCGECSTWPAFYGHEVEREDDE